MKRNLIKKTVMLLALSSALVLTGCGDSDDSGEASAVKQISAASVVSQENVSEKAEPVTEEVFNKVVINQIISDIGNAFKSMSPKTVEPGPLSEGSVLRSVKPADLKEAFSKLKESIKLETKESETGMSASAKGSWSAPTGDIDFGDEVKGISARLDAMKFNFNANYSMSEKGLVASANGSARVAGNAAFDFAGTDAPFTVIKAGKLNILCTASVSNGYAKMGPENLATAMELTAGKEVEPETVKAVIEYFDAIKGNANAYGGISLAVYFEAEDGEKLYNGVIKIDLTSSLSYSFTKESATALVDVIKNFIDATDKDVMEAKDFEPLEPFVSVKVDASVYDASGNKLFTVLNAEKASELFSIIMSFVEPEGVK